jgi:tRNA (guanine-N7-)-methyltransferase
VGKRKRKKWAEMETFQHVFQPPFKEIYKKDFHLKGKWHQEFFKNHNPITLELGCGKGEYTIGLATRFPERNVIGVDIKGARIWRGAKTALNEQLKNVAFIRTRIEQIISFFEKNEIAEIWLTFPDPQLKKRRNKKRLTAARFLNVYREFLSPGGYIHLKTDNKILYDYTLQMIGQNQLPLIFASENLYGEPNINPVLSITTHYEKQFLEQHITIKYLCFQLDTNKAIDETE